MQNLNQNTAQEIAKALESLPLVQRLAGQSSDYRSVQFQHGINHVIELATRYPNRTVEEWHRDHSHYGRRKIENALSACLDAGQVVCIGRRTCRYLGTVQPVYARPAEGVAA